ncbi:hypothetical protein Hanom_Chr17g01575191 [Helianthus anomalus]
MFTPNCRRCPLSLKLTGFVLNVSKSYMVCLLSLTQFIVLVKSGHQGYFSLFTLFVLILLKNKTK